LKQLDHLKKQKRGGKSFYTYFSLQNLPCKVRRK